MFTWVEQWTTNEQRTYKTQSNLEYQNEYHMFNMTIYLWHIIRFVYTYAISHSRMCYTVYIAGKCAMLWI